MATEKDSSRFFEEFISEEKNTKRIVDIMYGSKGPKKHNVIEVIYDGENIGRKNVRATKGKEFMKWFEEKDNRKLIGFDEFTEQYNESQIRLLMNLLIDSHFIRTAEKDKEYMKHTKKNFVKECVFSFTPDLVYIWDYDGPTGMKYLKTALTLASMVVIPTYRIWPRFLQNIVFYVSIAALILLIGLEIIRFLLFCFFYLLGIRLWIFPDLDRDDKGIFGVFTPLISVERIKDGKNKYRYAAFVALLAMVVALIYYPKQVTNAYHTTMHAIDYSMKWTKASWLQMKINVLDRFHRTMPSVENDVIKETSMYNPDNDVVEDFDEAVVNDDLMDLEDLDGVKLDIE